jgi:ribosomal protein S18 acetylase RimI-like enzyme
MNERRIQIIDSEAGLADELRERIYEYNAEATGIDDGRWMAAAVRDDAGRLVAGITGWTWAGCGYVDQLWVRADRRGEGLGSQLLDAAEAEARARGCDQMIVATHSFQAPGLYERRGYVERGRIEGYPSGHSHIHLTKQL